MDFARVAAFMLVFACFVYRDHSDTAVHFMFGRYSFVDVMFVQDKEILLYSTRPGKTFECKSLKKRILETLDYWRFQTDYLQLPVSDEEGELLLKAFSAFAEVQTPFNQHDYWLYLVPIRIPKEKALFDAACLSDTQAIILIVREFLGESHPLRAVLRPLNSRQTLASTLYETIVPVGKKTAWSELRRMLPDNDT